MNDIETLNRMINDAKLENDEVLVEYLTKALNHIIEKQKQQEDIKLKAQENINQEENITQEVKKEEVIENTKEEEEKKQNKIKDEDIKKMATGEVSRIIVTKTDNTMLESKYMDLKVNSKNFDLRVDLESILVTLALDDVTKEKNAIAKLYELLDKHEKPEDINDIKMFLNDIAKIGHVGLEAKESIENDYDNHHRKEVYNKYFDDEYEKEKRNADLLEMELEELHGKSNKNPNDYEEMIDRYNALIQKLERLYDETTYKVSTEKSQKLETTIQYLKNKRDDIKKYLVSLKEAIEETNRLFSY